MTTKSLIGEVDQHRLMEYTSSIAQYERLSGTEDEMKAFEYIKETLESFGLFPNLVEQQAYISLPRSASLSCDSESFECITHSMAPSADRWNGRLIRVDAENLDERLPADRYESIALIDGIATPGVVRKIQNLGFIGCIFINTSLTYEMIVSPVWGTPTPEKLKDLPKIPVVSVNEETGKRLIELSEKVSFVEMTTRVETRVRPIPLLTVDIEPGKGDDTFLLFSGHVDSWHFGAMDNGTANATMLEVARIFSNKKDELSRTLRLAFWSGHSHGRYAGSAQYCDENWLELHNHCVGHVNIDSVGGKGASILSQANTMEEMKSVASSSVKKISGQDFEGKRYGKAGDQSFWGVGIPSLYMGLSEQPPSESDELDAREKMFGGGGKSAGFGWWWHTVEDTLDKIDPDNLKRDCEVYLDSISQIVCENKLPIDQAAAIDDILLGLNEWSLKAGNALDFEEIMSRLKKVKSLYQEATSNLSDQVFNQLAMRMSRKLVPFNYVADSRYEYDTLFALPKVPALMDFNRLVEMHKGNEDEFFLKTKLKRKMNELLHTVYELERDILFYYRSGENDEIT
ncbi:hypothetical protein CEY16_08310 [Halalkalibacillus sediminis]|uniref:Peptidase M28 domain-containing protein n=1 Tax=Halalkalibacillus sediminis TaxID=2018042 RepID=A0A2I0QUD1_9BACI|nr:M28 family peptidase [Halalkalibacillus sediminis]PKR77918.1 hypothetical protein CEY16_08310 [Halalkalibacillus sediminis]